MCGSTAPVAPPPVVKSDPVADDRKARAEAQQKANAEIAARRKRLKSASLLTSGAAGYSAAPTNTLLAKATGSG